MSSSSCKCKRLLMHKRNKDDKENLPYCVSVVLKNCKMRINEKNVASFALCNSPTDKEGYLLKRGEVNKQFQRRWFILKGNLLFYFEKRYDREPIGVIILEGCTVELADNESDAYAFQLVFHGAGTRTYIMCAQSQDEMEVWMKVIACASYDYMKMMVTELNRQLVELKARHAQTQQAGAGSASSSEVPHSSSAAPVTSKSLNLETTMLGPGHQRPNPFNTPDTVDSLGQSLSSQLTNISYSGLSDVQRDKLTRLNHTSLPSTSSAFGNLNSDKNGPSVFQKLHNRYGEAIKLAISAKK